MAKATVADYEAIIATVTKYTEGCKKGDTALMR